MVAGGVDAVAALIGDVGCAEALKAFFNNWFLAGGRVWEVFRV
jgi:hypothetical protein